MAIIVQDDFTRPDDPNSLGTAPTGQVWQPYGPGGSGDTEWQILSDQAARYTTAGGGYALTETGVYNFTAEITIVNASYGGNVNNANFGFVFRWADENNYWLGTWSRAGRFFRMCAVIDNTYICSNMGFGGTQIEDGDVMKIVVCNESILGYLNDVLKVTINPSTFILNPLTQCPLGTMVGIQCGGGVIEDPEFALFDDFLVETNITCPGTVTYNCTVDGCVDPGDGSGEFATLEACETACAITPSWDCVEGVCIDPGTGLRTAVKNI